MDRLEIVATVLRAAHLVATLSLLGCLVFRCFVVPKAAAAEALPLPTVNRIAVISGALALVLGGAWLIAVAGTIAGANDFATLRDAVPVVARHTSFGEFVCLRLLLLTGALGLLAARARLLALVGAGAAIALQPMLGHIGASDASVLIPIEVAHLLAAGSWLGCLLPLLVCVIRAPVPLAVTLCERFTPVGLVAVGTIAVTALPQAGELIGGLGGLFGTTYGHWALLKIGLFFLALGLACLNRLVLTARFGTVLGRRGLIGSIAVEAVAVCCVVLAAAAMASSTPAAHVQPAWPFAWRPSLDAWDEPDLRWELLRLMLAVAAGLVLIGVSLAWRRFRLIALGLAVFLIAPFMPAMDLLFVEAYPTSYFRSTTGFSVDSITHGKTLFAARCAVCHDPQNGTGSGADLTAPHVWGHLDGELYWWVTNGVVDPEGNALMPGFGSVLSEDDRWGLIDFIRARNVGVQAADTGTWTPPVAAPITPLSCAGTEADELADLAPRVLLVVAGDASDPETLPDVVTIRLARGTVARPQAGECVAAAPTAWDAWRVLAGAEPERFAGYRAVVDGQGWLRAWLPPDAGADRVLAAVRDARDHPIAAGARPAGGHHH
jgi:putative copper export protein/mono/diheme cytochrome c family protein